MDKKVGFIFYEEIHHIHHFIGPFVELYNNEDFEVDIITFEGEHNYLYSILELFKIPKNAVKKTPTFVYRKILNKIRGRKQPSSIFLVRKNTKMLLKYDVLVFNDANHNYLIKKRKGDKPKFALLGYGSGEGNYIYNEKVVNFDLITVSGQKILELFESGGNFSKTNIKICGYQKFDIVKVENKNQKLFNNNKPVVLYNPHFKRGLSSFYSLGKEILDFFYRNKDFSLIFAPHINLFNKKGFLNENSIDKKYLNSDNIIIDFGSIKSLNMHYTLASDIYLGDVSSQVYEFLQNPRPCIFINSHNVNWKNNKHHQNWQLGKVISNIDDIDRLLKSANVWQE